MFNIFENIFGKFTLYQKNVTQVNNLITINAIPNHENLNKTYLKENSYEKQDNSLTNEIIAPKIFFWTCAWAYEFLPANIIILSTNSHVCKQITNLIIDELNKTAVKIAPDNGNKQFVAPRELNQECEARFLDVLRELKTNRGSVFIVDTDEPKTA